MVWRVEGVSLVTIQLLLLFSYSPYITCCKVYCLCHPKYQAFYSVFVLLYFCEHPIWVNPSSVWSSVGQRPMEFWPLIALTDCTFPVNLCLDTGKRAALLSKLTTAVQALLLLSSRITRKTCVFKKDIYSWTRSSSQHFHFTTHHRCLFESGI